MFEVAQSSNDGTGHQSSLSQELGESSYLFIDGLGDSPIVFANLYWRYIKTSVFTFAITNIRETPRNVFNGNFTIKSCHPIAGVIDAEFGNDIAGWSPE